MRPDLPAKDDLIFGVFMNCGSGERVEFTFSCCLRISSAVGTLLSSSIHESESVFLPPSAPVLPADPAAAVSLTLLRDNPAMDGQLRRGWENDLG
jgi:hypothetical protein